MSKDRDANQFINSSIRETDQDNRRKKYLDCDQMQDSDDTNCRKKRCVDRYESSESSDSGVVTSVSEDANSVDYDLSDTSDPIEADMIASSNKSTSNEEFQYRLDQLSLSPFQDWTDWNLKHIRGCSREVSCSDADWSPPSQRTFSDRYYLPFNHSRDEEEDLEKSFDSTAKEADCSSDTTTTPDSTSCCSESGPLAPSESNFNVPSPNSESQTTITPDFISSDCDRGPSTNQSTDFDVFSPNSESQSVGTEDSSSSREISSPCVSSEELRDNQENGFHCSAEVTSSETSSSNTSKIRFPAPNTLRLSEANFVCKWKDCNSPFYSISNFVEHVQISHVVPQRIAGCFTCYWENCRYFGRTYNCAPSWPDRHVHLHTGKTYQCVIPGCKKLFKTVTLQRRHITQHLSIPGKSNKKNNKKLKLKTRRINTSANRPDYFDSGIMERLLVDLNKRTKVMDSFMKTNDQNQLIVMCTPRLTALRTLPNGDREKVLTYTPHLIPDEFIPIDQLIQKKELLYCKLSTEQKEIVEDFFKHPRVYSVFREYVRHTLPPTEKLLEN